MSRYSQFVPLYQQQHDKKKKKKCVGSVYTQYSVAKLNRDIRRRTMASLCHKVGGIWRQKKKKKKAEKEK